MSGASSPKRLHEDLGEGEEQPGDKRARTQATRNEPLLPNGYLNHGISPDVEYQPGAIRRIRLKNFVTYTSVEFFPGPSLNMVIGPNGTGKSTLVCAICIGLGYPASLLGRGSLSEFVKHGFNEARIEIEMQKPPYRAQNPIFRCVLKREGNKASFTVDGTQCTVKQVKRRAEKLGCQIDNLCQFLPQDKVVEFSKMNDKELLNRTQRAVGTQEMLDWHGQLITTRKHQRQVQAAKEERSSTLTGLEAKHQRQEADVQRIRERDQVKVNIDLLESAKPFRQYRDAVAAHKDKKNQVMLLNESLAALELSVEPFVQDLKHKERYKMGVDAGAGQRKADVDRKLQLVENVGKEIDRTDGNVKKNENELSAEKRTAQAAKSNLARVQNTLNNLNLQMSQPCPASQANIDSQTENIRRCEREKRTLADARETDKTRYRELETQKTHRQHSIRESEARLEDLRTKKGQQVEKLKRLNRDAYEAYVWLQKNRKLFEKEVFGPPLVECSVKDPRLANIVENAISNADLQSFTTQTANDNRLLQRSLRELGRNRVNQRHITAEIDEYRTAVADLQAHDLTGWVLDLVDGPGPVLASLCEGAKINRTAYSLSDLSKEQYEGLERGNIHNVMTPSTSYRFTFRREYNASSVGTKNMRPAQHWTDAPVEESAGSELRRQISEATDEINQITTEMETIRKDKMHSYKTRIDQLTDEIKTLTDARTQMQKHLTAYTALPTRIEKLEEERDGHREKMNSYRDRERDLIRKGDELALDRTRLSLAFADAVAELQSAHDGLQEAQIILIEAISDLETLRERQVGVTRELEEKRKERDALNEEVRKAGNFGRRLAEQLQNIDQTQEQIAAKRAVVERFPNIQALESEIDSEQARLELMQGDSHGSTIAEYEKRAKEIAGLKKMIEEQEASLSEFAGIIATVRKKWEPKLDWLVQQISYSFSYNMAQINCAGEVGINKDEEDFDQWSIRIMVKFRESESLSQLDAHRQSGGERAVSTVFYLMSLQTLTKSPFRVVDEINQGMDPRNERLVHARMVAIATGTDDMPPPVMRMPRRRRQQEDNDDEDGADGTQEDEEDEEDEENEAEDDEQNDELRQEDMDALAQEHKGSQYFLITPKLLPDLKYQRGMRVLCIASGEHMPPAEDNAVDFRKQLEIRRGMLRVAAV